MFAKVIDWVQDTWELLKECLNDKDTDKNESVDLNPDEYCYPSFTELLPYQYFDEESKLFFNEYNAGLLYRIIPLTGANEQLTLRTTPP